MLSSNIVQNQRSKTNGTIQEFPRELHICKICGVKVRKDRMIKHLKKVHNICSITTKPSEKVSRGSCKSSTRNFVINTSRSENTRLYPYEFIQRILKKEFNEYFVPVSPYRLMFASGNHLVYFENTSQDSELLHYRINESPLRFLKSNHKATICLTDLPEGKAYLIPFDDILSRMSNVRWREPHLDVTIDKRYYSKHVWKELLWNIKKYLISY